MLELARRFEAAGASSFRAFVDRLAADAERGDAAEAPVVEEGTEGVRIMSVHKAKGLEFPVVVLCDPCAPAMPKMPSRLVDPQRRVWAMPLADAPPSSCSTRRTSCCSATAKRWCAWPTSPPPAPAICWWCPRPETASWPAGSKRWRPPSIPNPEARRQPRAAPGSPPFGKETVLERPDDLIGELSVSPGLHTGRAGTSEAVWWDPNVLQLDRETEGGVRGHDLLVEGGRSQETAAGHARWQASRAQAQSLWQAALAARRDGHDALDRPHRGRKARSGAAAGGPRIRRRTRARAAARKALRSPGHATLAEIPLKATPDEIARAARAQGRLAGAPAEEVEAAATAVAEALRHPLLQRAAQALEVRREEPLLHALPGGALLEGVVDLAFREAHGWTVVDFKTDARPCSRSMKSSCGSTARRSKPPPASPRRRAARGIGPEVAQQRMVTKEGRTNVVPRGLPKPFWGDFYHSWLNASWPRVLFGVSCVYLLT